MRIAVVGRPDDVIVKHLMSVLVDRAVDARVFSLSDMFHGTPLAFDGEAWLCDGECLNDYDAFFVRQVPATVPLLGTPDSTATAQVWWTRAKQAQERAQMATSCLLDLEARGKRVVNSPRCDPYDVKPFQLAELARAGIPIPKTLITNFPEAVRLFEADVGEVVCKPVGGGAEAQLLGDDAKARLEHISHTPVIFQQRIVGPDIRVTLVDGRVVSSVEIPSSTLDYRSQTSYSAGQQVYLSHPLPSDVADMCKRIAAMFHHTLAGIDLKKTRDGYVVIESNSMPVYLDIELKTQAPITNAIVETLLSARTALR